MVVTYTGILWESGRIEWVGPVPDYAGAQVTVTVQEPAPAPESQGRNLAQHMGLLSKTNLQVVFGDPLEWQREVRKSRPLPGREDGCCLIARSPTGKPWRPRTPPISNGSRA